MQSPARLSNRPFSVCCCSNVVRVGYKVDKKIGFVVRVWFRVDKKIGFDSVSPVLGGSAI